MKLKITSLRTKIILMVAVLVIAITAIIAYFLAAQQRQSYLDQYASSLSGVGRQIELELLNSVESLRRDVYFLAGTPPINGIIRASQNGGVDPLENSSLDVWQQRLQSIFASMTATSPANYQIRYIGIADNGRELVRVNSTDSGSEVVAPENLQQKGDRDYFLAVQNLQPGQVYFSEINLNRKNGVLDDPYRPTLRMATPVFTPAGDLFGMVIINRDMGSVFRDISDILRLQTEAEETQLYITNSRGEYLFHPDPALTFGFEFGNPHTILQDFTDATSLVDSQNLSASFLNTSTTNLLLAERAADKIYIHARGAQLDPVGESLPLLIMLGIPQLMIDAPIQAAIMKFTLSSVLIGALVLLLLVWFLSRQLAPLKLLSTTAQKLAIGDYSAKMPAAKSAEVINLIDSLKYMQTCVAEREDSLRASEMRANQIVQAIPQGIIIANERGHIHLVNSDAEKMFGYADGEMIGLTIESLLPSKLRKHHVQYRKGYMDNPQVRKMGDMRELTARRKDGSEFPIEVALAPIKFDLETRVITTVIDISKRRAMQAELDQHRNHLEETVAERTKELVLARDEAKRLVQVKSEFLANMSHEIRTPMTAVLGLLDILRHTDLTTRQLQYVFQIHNSSRALLHIINDILDISKIEAGKVTLENEDFSLLETVEGAVDLFAPSADLKNVSLHLKLDPGISTLLVGDRTRLTQVLNNLLGNAVKFTEQGQILLTVECNSKDDQSINVRFSVRDTGIGISEDAMSRLFQAFEQGDSATTRLFGGTGLGLAISQKMVELMGGQLQAKSIPGEGSTFWFDLSFGQSEKPELKMAGVRDLGKRVLVVDDQPINCEILAEMLNHWGCTVHSAHNGIEALANITAAAKRGESYDLLIVDWRMPEMDGIALIDKIHQLFENHSLNYDPPVLMVTEADRTEIMQTKNFDSEVKVLTKPVNISRLLNTLAEMGLIDLVTEGERDGARVALELLLTEELNALPSPPRLLLVEDNLTNQMVVKELLSRYRLTVITANDGAEAVDYIRNGEFDLVLMDLQMPVMDGFEATKKIREFKSKESLPILALSAATFIEDVLQANRAGMNEHLNKPIDIELLLSALLKWLPLGNKTSPVLSESAKVAQSATAIFDNSGRSLEKLVESLNNDVQFDLSATILAYAGQSAYFRLLQTFCSEFGDTFKAWDQGANWEHDKKRRVVHSIKGATANIGAVTLAELALTTEVDIHQGDDSRLAELMQHLKQLLHKLNVLGVC